MPAEAAVKYIAISPLREAHSDPKYQV